MIDQAKLYNAMFIHGDSEHGTCGTLYENERGERGFFSCKPFADYHGFKSKLVFPSEVDAVAAGNACGGFPDGSLICAMTA